MNKKLAIPALLATLVACQPKPTLREQLIGNWENTSLDVEMNTVDGTDSTGHMVAEEGQWEEVLGIKPIQTVFNADSTFSSTYYNLDGEKLGVESGEWEVVGDSLILKSENYASAYHVVMEKDKVRFRAYLDWDQDGSDDDLYDGWQKRVTPKKQ